jgi:hypothetical protein
MGPRKKVGFELEFGSDTSFNTLRRKMAKETGITGIKIHEDYSVETRKKFNGEFVTPVWNLGEGMKNLHKMFRWMRKNDIVTDSTTGLHVNVSFANKELTQAIDPAAVLLLTDDIKWLEVFDRLDNEYVMTPKQELSNCIRSILRLRNVTIETLKSYMYQRVLMEYSEAEEYSESESDLDDGHFFDKYFSINLMKLAEKVPYIEYRFIGGDHYHCVCQERKVFAALDDILTSFDKSISNRYEGVKTKYIKNMLTPAQRKRIKNK